MNRQEIFNTVATHLLTQNQQSFQIDEAGGKKCMYRGPNGLKCAIGALIKDEFYSEELEGMWCGALSVYKALIKSIGNLNPPIPFLAYIQDVHDHYSPGEWLNRLEAFAINEGLDTKVLDSFRPAM